MTATPPTRKDMAEFFRLCLLTGLCETATIAQWADSVVATDASPHIAFIELCISASQSASAVVTLLGDVPGPTTPGLPVQMLLGHASRLVAERAFAPEQLLLRLYAISNHENFPDRICDRLVGLEDDYALARDGVYGTLAEVGRDTASLLKEYEQYAPDKSTGTV
jgi:hypothetical protein